MCVSERVFVYAYVCARVHTHVRTHRKLPYKRQAFLTLVNTHGSHNKGGEGEILPQNRIWEAFGGCRIKFVSCLHKGSRKLAT